MTIPAVFFGVIGVAIVGTLGKGLQAKYYLAFRSSSEPSRAVPSKLGLLGEDPVSFWIAITLVVFMSLGTLAVALGSI